MSIFTEVINRRFHVHSDHEESPTSSTTLAPDTHTDGESHS